MKTEYGSFIHLDTIPDSEPKDCKNPSCKKGPGGTPRKFTKLYRRQKFCCTDCRIEFNDAKKPILAAKKGKKKSASN